MSKKFLYIIPLSLCCLIINMGTPSLAQKKPSCMDAFKECQKSHDILFCGNECSANQGKLCDGHCPPVIE